MRILFGIFLFISTVSKAQDQVLRVYFNHNQDKLSQRELVKITDLINTQPELKVTSIKAYCDTTGSANYNLELAERRLKGVQEIIPKDRQLETQLFAAGENYPIDAKQTTLKEWRKVEIHFTIEKVRIEEIVELEAESSLKRSVFDSLNLEDVLAEDADPIVLDIQFFPGMDVLMAESWAEIDKLFLFLKQNDKVHAFIRGHVCCGSDMYLSYSRAYAVYNSMIKRGISPKRLDLKGFDNTKPRVWPEVTDEDRQMNRRVDVMFSLMEE